MTKPRQPKQKRPADFKVDPMSEAERFRVAQARALNSVPSSIAKVSRGQRRKHLDERLRALYQRVMMIEDELKQLDDDRFYRACIFGSARIKPEMKEYQDVYTLARYLAWRGVDILTGGGPGLMEAGNKGAQLGQQEKNTKSLSYGISIQLDFEPVPNQHLDVKRHHQKFSSRLDDFMRLSHIVVVTPGGVGTLLELFFAWQLIQVKHIGMRPIILLDKKFWTGLIDWMREMPLGRGLVSAKDFDFITIVDTPEEAFEIVSKHHDAFLKSGSRRVGAGSEKR
jgi:uncharacterized protein (TIGR00730 family)